MRRLELSDSEFFTAPVQKNMNFVRNLTLRQLQIFVVAARHLSYARAAEELHLTPPAVSMQLKQLEDNVGLPLFERMGRGVALIV